MSAAKGLAIMTTTNIRTRARVATTPGPRRVAAGLACACALTLSAQADATDVVWYPDTRTVTSLVGSRGSYGRRIEAPALNVLLPTSRGGTGVEYGDEFITRIDIGTMDYDICKLTVYVAHSGPYVYGGTERELGSIDRCSQNFWAHWPGDLPYGDHTYMDVDVDPSPLAPWLPSFVGTIAVYTRSNGRVDTLWATLRNLDIHTNQAGWESYMWRNSGTGVVSAPKPYLGSYEGVAACPGAPLEDKSLATGVIARFDGNHNLVGLKLICHMAEYQD